MDAMIVVDMQVDLLKGEPKHDLHGVVDRINLLAAMIRSSPGELVWIRHCGGTGEDFERQSTGGEFLPELDVAPDDIVVEKTLNDPFVGTSLRERLNVIAPERVLIAGWATDFCVDATVRSAVSNNYRVVVVSDGHTLSDRPHLSAPAVIEHHNWIWSGLITNRSIEIRTTADLLDESRRIR